MESSEAAEESSTRTKVPMKILKTLKTQLPYDK